MACEAAYLGENADALWTNGRRPRERRQDQADNESESAQEKRGD
jgi:hypothetical protein